MRTCKICGKALSIYNENKYCFAHMREGQEKEDADQDREYYRHQCNKYKEKKGKGGGI